MVNIARFDPFGDLMRLDLEDVLRVPRMRSLWKGLPDEPQIKIDVSQDDKTYHVKAEVPGVNKDDVKISIDGNQVTISAEVKNEKEVRNGEKVIRSERYYGSQFRGFTLQHDIDQDKAEAKYVNGILELTLPKKGMASAKQLAIK